MPVIELNTGTCQGDLQGPLPCYSLQAPQSEEADSKQKTTMKKNKLGKQYIPGVKATVIKTMCFCSKDYWNRKKNSEINPCLHHELVFNRFQDNLMAEEINFLINFEKTTGYSYSKE